MSIDTVIQTRGLSKMYNDTLAVNGLDLEVHRGTIYGFLGLNGAGKTTTIKMLLNLAYPSAGKGLVLGHDIVTETLQIREKTGYVEEEPRMYDYMVISELVNFCKSLYVDWDMKVVGRYLDLFGLSVGRKVKDLSKGMKSQLALALALGSRPELLILDEPSGGLDPLKARDFFRAVVEQVAETGQTVFFSSHHLSEVERVADTVGIIHRGKMVFNSSLDEIKTNLKKIRVVLDRENMMTDIGTIPGVQHISMQGRGYLLEVDCNTEEIIARLNQLQPIDLELIDMSLEDVFIRYTGGV